MSQTAREVVRRAVTFQGPDRLPRALTPEIGTDFAGVGMSPSPDARPPSGTDEWGAEWENIGVCQLGEVKRFPLKTWDDLDRIAIPDVRETSRWQNLEGARERAGDRFLMAQGLSLYERPHFLRGLENLWMDIYQAPESLERLLDLLVDMNLYAIEQYATVEADGYMFCDDWGLQDRMMISPDAWRALWKPRYARVYRAAHDAGMLTFLHSCGHIVDILDDLIDAGLDVIQMDQQENMGLDLLSERFGGRLTFYCPADIQAVMRRPLPEIRDYTRRMVATLGRAPRGGFIAKWYGDAKGAGHSPEAIAAMCEAFDEVSRELYGA